MMSYDSTSSVIVLTPAGKDQNLHSTTEKEGSIISGQEDAGMRFGISHDNQRRDEGTYQLYDQSLPIEKGIILIRLLPSEDE
jgi:hypothetical protein